MKTKEQKRLEAEVRNGEWRALSPKAQLAELDKRGLTASKQRTRLLKKLAKAV